ncbi:hypothetical protein BU23DRAFT_474396, partial [Bimuria novae-zelandiae CBS 107.79]
ALRNKIKFYKIEPAHIYNIDKKGFIIRAIRTIHNVDSLLLSRSAHTDKVSKANRAWITLLACICANGSALPPSLIYEAVNKGIQLS